LDRDKAWFPLEKSLRLITLDMEDSFFTTVSTTELRRRSMPLTTAETQAAALLDSSRKAVEILWKAFPIPLPTIPIVRVMYGAIHDVLLNGMHGQTRMQTYWRFRGIADILGTPPNTDLHMLLHRLALKVADIMLTESLVWIDSNLPDIEEIAADLRAFLQGGSSR
jgi:hypothetical protein